MSTECMDSCLEWREERDPAAEPLAPNTSRPPLPSNRGSGGRSLCNFLPKNDLPADDCRDLSEEIEGVGISTDLVGCGQKESCDIKAGPGNKNPASAYAPSADSTSKMTMPIRPCVCIYVGSCLSGCNVMYQPPATRLPGSLSNSACSSSVISKHRQQIIVTPTGHEGWEYGFGDTSAGTDMEVVSSFVSTSMSLKSRERLVCLGRSPNHNRLGSFILQPKTGRTRAPTGSDAENKKLRRWWLACPPKTL